MQHSKLFNLRWLVSLSVVGLLGLSPFCGNAKADLVKVDGPALQGANITDGSGNVVTQSSIFGTASSRLVVGDTYNVAPVVQTATGAFYLSTPGNVNHVFSNSTNKFHGNNGAYPQGAGTMVVSELLTELGPNQYLLQVELSALNASGALTPWIPAGVTANGSIFTSWRMDLGTLAAAPDRLTPSQPILAVESADMFVFDSAGDLLAAFPMTSDATDPLTGLAGAGIVGLGGDDIAGVDMASFQLAWTYRTVPEPTSFALLSLGMVGLLGRRRR